MNIKDLGTQLLFTTVHIWAEKKDGGKSTGTGFIYSVDGQEKDTFLPFLVTANHVTQDSSRVLVEFVLSENDAPNPGEKFRAEIEGKYFEKYREIEDDLSAIPLAGLFNHIQRSGKEIFCRSIDETMVPENDAIAELSAIEEVTFIGYPSGLHDQVNGLPLVRKGTTSSPIWSDFKGKSCFVIDAGVFPGSSGSPVFIFNNGAYAHDGNFAIGNRLLFVGMVSDVIRRRESAQPNVYLNLGKVIKAAVVKEFLSSVVAKLGE